jgi:hypothetical protein
MLLLTLSKTAMRSYVMGRQGLWPGRSAAGKSGAVQVICQLGELLHTSRASWARSDRHGAIGPSALREVLRELGRR